jgi:hypothetical protein
MTWRSVVGGWAGRHFPHEPTDPLNEVLEGLAKEMLGSQSPSQHKHVNSEGLQLPSPH